jgi:triosephosphate isomerase
MIRPVLIINFKNYREVLGENSIRLSMEAGIISKEIGLEIIVAPPAPMLYAVANQSSIPVYSQKLDNEEEGKSTGALIPESVKKAGCKGSILNHSESRMKYDVIRDLISRMKRNSLSACVCVETVSEMKKMLKLSPEFLAIEPPELIGSGVAVSKARPELITRSVSVVREGKYKGRVLCGAGIVDAHDVAIAKKLGIEGVLVSSSVVKSNDWKKKITELASALVE